ncbi:tumor susceptibility protein 101-like [Brachionus plicatilis]|uniref:Tumor susceptibility protein 101-like n=1 Tax=Brachionus plicatilis TaxID=10195 RepID=A0A3M7QQD3_BRAPC|nr:tumor susceptibility protein 101-like [Brachionus plicatilis]
MTSNERILNDLLYKCSYKYKDCTKRDIMGALTYFKDLSPKTDKYVYPTGIVKELVCLLGTIPVNFRSSVYNIPVQIYLNDTHPYEAPIAYVRPTAEMSVNVCETVDASGRIRLPCLTEWNHQNSDLYMLLNLMAIKFSEQTPLFSKPVRSTAIASASTGAINSHGMSTPPYPSDPRSPFSHTPPYPTASVMSYPTPYPASNNPYYPMPTAQAYNPMKSVSNPNMNQATARVSYPDDTIKPEHYRMSLISAVQDKIRAKFKDVYEEKAAEMDSLKRVNSDLESSESALNALITEAENECLNIEHLSAELRTDELNESLKLIRHRDSTSVEDAVVTPGPLYRQMVQLYAEEMAIQDLLYFLSQGVIHKSVDLDNFLKQVRLLSRKQFYLRATLNKARQQAALPL